MLLKSGIAGSEKSSSMDSVQRFAKKEDAQVRRDLTYSASNWLGKIRSAWCMIFLYAGTTSSFTYIRP